MYLYTYEFVDPKYGTRQCDHIGNSEADAEAWLRSIGFNEFSLVSKLRIPLANIDGRQVHQPAFGELKLEVIDLKRFTTYETAIQRTISRAEGFPFEILESLGDLDYADELDGWYEPDIWESFTLKGAAFRCADGVIAIEVLPRIFLRFNPDREPQAGDFYFETAPSTPILRNNSDLDAIRMQFHPDSKHEDILEELVGEQYGSHGFDRLEMQHVTENELNAFTVAAGIYGIARHASTDREFLSISKIVRDEIRGIATDFESEELYPEYDFDDLDDVFDGVVQSAAWLACAAALMEEGYFRKLSREDLDGWRIREPTIDVIELVGKALGDGGPDEIVGHKFSQKIAREIVNILKRHGIEDLKVARS